jgi:hypothetical protein
MNEAVVLGWILFVNLLKSTGFLHQQVEHLKKQLAITIILTVTKKN